jgi:hypothetical protein
MLIQNGIIFRVHLEKRSKDEKKNGTKKERKEAYEALKLCSLLFGFNDVKHDLIGF